MTQPNVRSVYDLISDRFGVGGIEVIINRENVDVDIADKVIARLDPARVGLVIINLGTSPIFVSPTNAAATTRGIRLSENGGNLTLNYLDDLALCAYEWHGVSSVDNMGLFTLDVLVR
jgi:hypothetical protein